MAEAGTRTGAEARDRRVAIWCAAVAFAMLGAAFAAVPLYTLFCRVTGYGGTPQRVVQASQNVLDRVITIRFDANVAPGFAWNFKPEQRTLDVKIGENTLAFYRAENSSKETLTGTATFNVTPEIAGSYFNKVECFCFTEQKLEPGQSIDMPVSFFVDPAILEDEQARDLTQITLSYTFYHTTKAADAAGAAAAAPTGSRASGS